MVSFIYISLLFFYAFLSICFSRRDPDSERSHLHYSQESIPNRFSPLSSVVFPFLIVLSEGCLSPRVLFLWLLCYYCLTTGIDSDYVLEELIKGRISGFAGAAFYHISDETSEDYRTM